MSSLKQFERQPSEKEVLEYVSSMLRELRDIAHTQLDDDMAVYFLEMSRRHILDLMVKQSEIVRSR